MAIAMVQVMTASRLKHRSFDTRATRLGDARVLTASLLAACALSVAPHAWARDGGMVLDGSVDAAVDAAREASSRDVQATDVGPIPDRMPIAGLCPNVIVVLDNSCSMSAAASDGGPSKWTTSVNAIEALMHSDGSHLRLGLSLFPCPTCTPGCAVPTLAEAIAVEPGNDTSMALETSLTNATRTCSTPTGPYLQAIRTDPAMNDPTRVAYALLLTDGAPTCPGGGIANSVPATVAAINDLRAIGVRTFVVGFDANVNATALDAFAVAGGEPLPASAPHRFYGATDEASLEAVFTAIATTVSEELGGTLCDESCYSRGCPTGEVCSMGTCTADPCVGVMCAAGSYCANGTCHTPCIPGCPSGQLCHEGTCAADPCASMSCNGCVNGVCPTAGCLDGDGGVRVCGPQRVCQGDQCVDYPCLNTHCPAGTVCDSSGGCQGSQATPDSGVADSGIAMDANRAGDSGPTTTSDATCACRTVGRPRRASPFALIAFASLLGLSLRRRSRLR